MPSPMLTGAGTMPIRAANGLPVPRWFHPSTSTSLRELPLRENDVILASWPKSGTHWVFRALRLLSLGAATPDAPMILAEVWR